MPSRLDLAHSITRRHFLERCHVGLGSIALAGMAGAKAHGATATDNPLAVKTPPLQPKAKRVIYLHMAGSPPQHELFDYKPKLKQHHLQPCPDELMKNVRFAFIKGHPKLLGCPYKFSQHGDSGAWVSELMPNFSKLVDDVTFIKSMKTDQFNHAPAQLYLYTGSPRFGGASMGSWVTWGLGSENQDLPGFVVLVSGGTDPSGGKSLWGSGFLPSVFQGVQCRTKGDPILYASNPKGMSRDVRRRSLDALKNLNEAEWKRLGDPETLTRISQYELAFRMQMAVPEVMDIRREPTKVREMYGAEPGESSFANNCLLARRLVEQGVRYVQLFDWGWDIHGTGKHDDIMNKLPQKCRDVDQPIAALLTDLKQRGLLDDTLVIWSGEFGRTSMNEARNGSTYLGRDHHPYCFTMWMAGGGVKRGHTHGASDELGYFITENETSVHDLQATILHLLGFDPHQLKFPYQGLEQRLIGPANDPRVCQEILA
ncbi:hypothetical protein Pan216_42520 [Planctomycetes bacterium Pan216]|uniref:Sulfatase n=1 Tax=Kolteria novifilia TaxID=2527975 RepID=A0A518B8R8_9BACT|nr:hypothetical protein Pan216_42520 [Planctomycetes bacterium Pan216]